MDRDDVPSDEMFRSGRARDELDAVLRGEPVDDPDLVALVHDLRDAALPDAPRPRSAALAAFAGPAADGTDPAHQPVPAPAASRPEPEPLPAGPGRARLAIGALVATIAGKILLGGAVAAAAVGGLHAAEVVDVPLLPDVRRHPPATTPAPEPAPPAPVGADAPAPTVAEPGADDGRRDDQSRPADDRPTAPSEVPGADRPDRPGAEVEPAVPGSAPADPTPPGLDRRRQDPPGHDRSRSPERDERAEPDDRDPSDDRDDESGRSDDDRDDPEDRDEPAEGGPPDGVEAPGLDDGDDGTETDPSTPSTVNGSQPDRNVP